MIRRKKIRLIDLKKDNHELKHHLELSEANACMENRQCVSLGLEIAQLKKGVGETGIPVEFAGVVFRGDEWLYADQYGALVLPDQLR